jgi:hypothetical protein
MRKRDEVPHVATAPAKLVREKMTPRFIVLATVALPAGGSSPPVGACPRAEHRRGQGGVGTRRLLEKIEAMI